MLDKNKFIELQNLVDFVNKNTNKIPGQTLYSYNEDFDIKFSHESTKIEGNTLTIHEVKTILIDNISIGGKELREIYEVTNNQKAFNYVKKSVKDDVELSEDLIKDIHQLVTENILVGGIYRDVNVKISGASFTPPDWTYVRNEMKFFIKDYNTNKNTMNTIELAAWVHSEFVRIHPFADGNGRTARLLLNYILLKEGYYPLIIKAIDRPRYYDSLDNYGANKDISKFVELVYEEEVNILEEYKLEIDRNIKRNKSKDLEL